MSGHETIVMHYEPGLVVLSIAVAILAAYTALDHVRHTEHGQLGHDRFWLVAGATALGTGIWTMHFIAMLAMKMETKIYYDGPITILSLVIAILACAAGLRLVSENRRARILLLGGTIIGLGVAAMHYTGMAAIRFAGVVHYDPTLVAVSVLIAVGAAIVALSIPPWLKMEGRAIGVLIDIVVASVMGAAIAGMHYTGMAATEFVAMADAEIPAGGFVLDIPGMATAIAAGGGLLMSLVLVSSYLHRRWSGKLENEKELHRASEERLQNIINEVSDGIVGSDDKGLIRMFNPAAARLFGYAPAEIIGRNVSVLMPDPHRSHHDGYIAEYLRTGKGKIIGIGPREVEGVNKQGTPLPLELAINEITFAGERQFIAVLRDITARKKAQAGLFHQANYDALTGLLNRHMFQNRLEHAILQANRIGSRFALLFLDLDSFKVINDSLGHDAGDKMLISVADRIKQNTRASDSVARLGGDEFVILIDVFQDKEHAAKIANKLLQAISLPHFINGSKVSMSASIGIAIYPLDADTADTLLQSADGAMYAAKGAGKNCYQFATDDSTRSSKERRFPKNPE
jgi:diguanylate cyclase